MNGVDVLNLEKMMILYSCGRYTAEKLLNLLFESGYATKIGDDIYCLATEHERFLLEHRGKKIYI